MSISADTAALIRRSHGFREVNEDFRKVDTVETSMLKFPITPLINRESL